MKNLPEELGYVAGHENKAFSIIICWSVKTTLNIFHLPFLLFPKCVCTQIHVISKDL